MPNAINSTATGPGWPNSGRAKNRAEGMNGEGAETKQWVFDIQVEQVLECTLQTLAYTHTSFYHNKRSSATLTPGHGRNGLLNMPSPLSLSLSPSLSRPRLTVRLAETENPKIITIGGVFHRIIVDNGQQCGHRLRFCSINSIIYSSFFSMSFSTRIAVCGVYGKRHTFFFIY